MTTKTIVSALLLLLVFAMAAPAQIIAAATWFDPQTDLRTKDLQPPLPAPRVLTVYMHPAPVVTHMRIQIGSATVDLAVGELDVVGLDPAAGWYSYSVTGIIKPDTITLWALVWSEETDLLIAKAKLPVDPPNRAEPVHYRLQHSDIHWNEMWIDDGLFYRKTVFDPSDGRQWYQTHFVFSVHSEVTLEVNGVEVTDFRLNSHMVIPAVNSQPGDVVVILETFPMNVAEMYPDRDPTHD